MNQDVHPLTALMVIIIAACLIGFIFWARAESLRVGGPDQVQYDSRGNVYIHIANDLYQFSPSFKLLQTYHLPALGVHDLVGDFAFFSNGDILIRRGKYDPGFIESILRVLRVADAEKTVANPESEGLHRCSLQTKACTLFSNVDNPMDYNAAFHLSIDWSTDTVYLSDTGRHKLRKFNAAGQEVAVQDEGYKFPNQNMIFEGKLLVADTNHHAIQEASIADEQFGKIETSHSMNFDRKNWTFSFARVGNDWWVNNMSNNMSNGSVFVLDSKWNRTKQIELPTEADPIDIAVFENHVVITDLNNVRLYQLDYEGQLLDKALPQAVQDKLDNIIEKQQQFRNKTFMGILLFIAFIVSGFLIAVTQSLRQKEPPLELTEEEMSFDIRNPDIQWVGKNQQKLRLLKLVVFLPALLIPLILVLVFSGDASIRQKMPLFELSLLLLVFLLLPVLFKKLANMQMGVLGELLVLKTGKDYAAAKGKNIFYSDYHILIGKVSLPLNQQNMIFETQDVVQKIMPVLKHASYVKNGQMMSMLLRRQQPWKIGIVAILSILGVGLLLGQSYY